MYAAPSTGAAAITGSPRDLLVAMLINTSGPAPLDSTATQGARWACSYRRPRCTSHSMRSENNQGHAFQLAQATTQIHCSLLQRVPVQDCGPHLCSFDRIVQHPHARWSSPTPTLGSASRYEGDIHAVRLVDRAQVIARCVLRQV